MELLGRVFELFTQVDATPERAQGGLGIGLTLVRSLVEMHGGSVQVRSEGPGRGAEFSVLLPLAAASAARAAGGGSGVVARPTSPLRLLVVDDNVDAAESLAMVLRDRGHEVRSVHQPADVVEMARTFRPHVVFLDIGLPVIDGYEVARRLRQTPEVARACLVALTGYGQDENRRLAKDAGFDLHWVKPVDLDVLENLLTGIEARTPSS
jgi:CheY-like chemotaxis protein